MSRSFHPSELPNPILLTDPANLAFMKKELEKEKQKEKALAPITNNQKKRKTDASDSSTSKKKAKKNAADDAAKDNLFSIVLPGDEDGTVELYDSCDELRRKINALLRTGTITKAAFLRDISRAAYANASNIQSKQLTDFLSKKGATSGSTSRVCYASYVYFEKKRIAEGKTKSKHRLDMEDRWEGEGGLPREREHKYICGVDQEIVQDALGSVRAVPSRY
ncbi:Calcineurin is a calcium-dependent protein [Mycena venus]|uniref:Calcineurin is a calcium-dependent protein n=1 Tax=Mycena venus TaxID=2733690 RepID=A0A8H6XGG1_9AGAR|nr:Calcineurin is a calcium-dependent protein [Mycena venus]